MIPYFTSSVSDRERERLGVPYMCTFDNILCFHPDMPSGAPAPVTSIVPPALRCTLIIWFSGITYRRPRPDRALCTVVATDCAVPVGWRDVFRNSNPFLVDGPWNKDFKKGNRGLDCSGRMTELFALKYDVVIVRNGSAYAHRVPYDGG